MTTPESASQHRVTTLVLCALATFMAALDGSVVNVALPMIRADFHASVAAMDWVVSTYLLSICALLLAAGRLGDAFGYVRLMCIGFVVFGVSSLFCGSANGLVALSIARGVQGTGASMLMAAGPALIAAAFPAQQRGRALGAIATATYIGLALGPTVGGFVAGTLSWRWVFWINLPITAAGTVLGLRLLRTGPKPQGRQPFDWAGAVLWAALLVSSLVAIENQSASWMARAGLGLVGLVLLVLFVRAEGQSSHPVLPLRLFRDTAFSGGVGAAWIQYGALFILNFMLPFFLEEVRGMTPQRAGVIMTAQPIVMMATTAPAGWVSDRIGPRLPSTVGLVIFAVGMGILGLFTPAGGVTSVIVGLAVVGLGVGLFTTPNNSAILTAAPPTDRGVASGLLAAARNVGMVCGVAAAGTFLAGVAGAEALSRSFAHGVLTSAGLALVAAVLSALRPVRHPAGATRPEAVPEH